jgi:hypothetical protein
VVHGGAGGSVGDVLTSGTDRGARRSWRSVPPRWAVAGALLAVLAAGLGTLATGAAEPVVVPPPPLGTLGPAGARLDDGRLLVRVEAELRTREPVVLRSGVVTGGGLVVLVDPVPAPEPGAPDAVTSRVVALVEPGCPEGPTAPVGPPGEVDPVLQVVVAPQGGGAEATLRSDIPLRSFAGAARAACAPVQASLALPADSGPVAEQVEVSVRLVDATVPVQVLRLTGRGLRVEATALGPLVAAAAADPSPGARPAVTVSALVVVTDCSVEVLAPRRLVLEVQRGPDLLEVPVQAGPEVVAGLDELVRRTCRRARG